MEVIKIGFCDFWDDFHIKDTKIYTFLCKKYNVIIDNNNPDILFFSCWVFGNKHNSYTNCIKVHMGGECDSPLWYNADFYIGFDYNNMDNYLRYPWIFINRSDKFYKCCNFDSNRLSSIKTKTSFCSFISNNPGTFILRRPENNGRIIINGAEYRKFVVKYITENYKKVDCNGTVLNNAKGKVLSMEPNIVKKYYNNYKFAITFENQSYPGYLTEKFFVAATNGCVPIYWGDPKITEDINSQSFINANNLSLDDLVDKIKEVDNNDNLYYSMLNNNIFKKGHSIIDYDMKLEQFLDKITNRLQWKK